MSPYPISVRPPRPGDGSGICEPPEDDKRREREQERRGQKYGREWAEKELRKAREKKAYRAFREVFGE